jgi:CMP-N-acetylneuraminic acid synthetase
LNDKIDKSLVIAIICARGGSKGLPRKNTLSIDGETLIARPIKHAIESGVVGTVLVSTDDLEIASLATSAGAIVPFLRPKNLSDDLATTEDTLKHALLEYEKIVNKKFEICVFLTPTDIFRNPQWIKEAVLILSKNKELDSVFVGYPTHKNFWEKNLNGEWVRLKDWMKIYASRQIRNPIVREDTGLACASRADLWRNGRRIGDKVEIIINNDDYSSIDIHTANDLLLAEAAMQIKKGSK